MYNEDDCDCPPCWTLKHRGLWYSNCEYQEDESFTKTTVPFDWDDEDD